MKAIILLVSFLLFPLVAYADLSFDELQAVTLAPDELEGRFKQKKYLSSLDTDLHSSGTFNYQRGVSIHWNTLQPIKNELLMTPALISNKQGDQEFLRIEDTNPIVSLFNEIFFSVLTSEWQKLASHFTLEGEMRSGQWQATLIPIDSTIKQLVEHIEIEGDELAREIVFYESGGDRTTITLESFQP